MPEDAKAERTPQPRENLKSDEETGNEGQTQINSPMVPPQPDDDFADLLAESKRMLFDLKCMEDDRMKDVKRPEALVFEDVDDANGGQQENVQILNLDDREQAQSLGESPGLGVIEEDPEESQFKSRKATILSNVQRLASIRFKNDEPRQTELVSKVSAALD